MVTSNIHVWRTATALKRYLAVRAPATLCAPAMLAVWHSHLVDRRYHLLHLHLAAEAGRCAESMAHTTFRVHSYNNNPLVLAT